MLFSEVDCLLVGQYGSWVTAQEFLLHAHVVVGNRQHCNLVLVRFLRLECAWHVFQVVVQGRLRVEPLSEHHFLEQDDCAHRVVECQLVLVELGEDGTNIQMRIRLRFGSLESAFDGEGSLQKVKGSSHFTDSSVVAGHVVEGHGLAELVVLAELFGLLEQVQGTVDVLLLQVVDCQNIADLAQLFAGSSELSGVGAEV